MYRRSGMLTCKVQMSVWSDSPQAIENPREAANTSKSVEPSDRTHSHSLRKVCIVSLHRLPGVCTSYIKPSPHLRPSLSIRFTWSHAGYPHMMGRCPFSYAGTSLSLASLDEQHPVETWASYRSEPRELEAALHLERTCVKCVTVFWHCDVMARFEIEPGLIDVSAREFGAAINGIHVSFRGHALVVVVHHEMKSLCCCIQSTGSRYFPVISAGGAG